MEQIAGHIFRTIGQFETRVVLRSGGNITLNLELDSLDLAVRLKDHLDSLADVQHRKV